VHIGTPTEISPALDHVELTAFAEFAEDAGLRIAVSLGSLNPVRPDRSPEALAAGDGDLRAGFVALVRAAARLGARSAMLVVGREEDRFASPVPFSEQLSLLGELLAAVRSRIEDTGVRVLIKTHQELTSWEALRLVDSAGSAYGVAFDPVNSIVRMEDPLGAARRLAGAIGQVHVDDARLVAWAGGVGRALCPIGDGVLPWSDLIAAVGTSDPDAWWWGEAHRAELTMPFRADGWFRAHPDAPLEEIASWLAQAAGDAGGVPVLLGDVDERVEALVARLGSP
jgi:sugar phosphate isomerase/epimerase